MVCDFLFKPCVVIEANVARYPNLASLPETWSKHVNTCSETAAEKLQKEQLYDKHQCILKSNSICAASTLNVSITCYREQKASARVNNLPKTIHLGKPLPLGVVIVAIRTCKRGLSMVFPVHGVPV